MNDYFLGNVNMTGMGDGAYQLHRNESHLDDEALIMPVREIQDHINWCRRNYAECGHCSTDCIQTE